MSDALILECETIYNMNLNLLRMAREGEWDGFIEQVQDYIIRLQTVLSNHPQTLERSAQDRITFIIKALVENEAEMTQNLKIRLDVLQKEISSLSRGRKCNRAYSASFTSILQ